MKFTEMENKEDLSKYMKWERPSFVQKIYDAFSNNPDLMDDIVEDARMSESVKNEAKRINESEEGGNK